MNDLRAEGQDGWMWWVVGSGGVLLIGVVVGVMLWWGDLWRPRVTFCAITLS